MKAVRNSILKKAGAKKPIAIDLFCGVGGLTHGLERAGLRVKAGIDIDAACNFAYETNNGSKFIASDVMALSPGDLETIWGDSSTRVLVGCAPCQPFSKYSGGRSRQDQSKPISRFAYLVKHLRPEVVSMENVAAVESYPAFSGFVSTLKTNGYQVSWEIVDASAYGVPQKRKRLILVASRLGEVKLPEPTTAAKPPTVRQSIAALPHIAAGAVHATDPVHRASDLSSLNLRRIQASKPGGTWRDWSDDLRAACHRVSSGATYPAVYGRMEWDAPGPTVTTQFFGYGNGRFGHPDQDRALSLREGAMLQTFPRNYQFERADERRAFTQIGKHIGNAVPVSLATAIGKSIRTHIEEHE